MAYGQNLFRLLCSISSWGRYHIIYIKIFNLTVKEFSGPTNAPVNVTAIWALDVIIGIFALGHDSILTNAAFVSFQVSGKEDVPGQVRAILAVVVVGPRAIRKTTLFAAYLGHFVYLPTAIAFALKEGSTIE